MAFMIFLDELSDPQAPHKQLVAESLATTEHVLTTLDFLETIEGCDNDEAKAYKAAYGWVKPAWDAIVQDLGLSLAEYEELVKFKKESVMIDGYAGDDEEEEAEAEDSLRALQSSTVKVLVKYKEPLVALLRILLGMY